jgi:hypothetical protein
MGIGLGISLEVNVMVRGIGCDRNKLVSVRPVSNVEL